MGQVFTSKNMMTGNNSGNILANLSEITSGLLSLLLFLIDPSK